MNPQTPSMEYEVIVVGSGIAGLSCSLKLAEKGLRTAVITKKNKADSNTNYAQGGIACVVSSSDDFEIHVNDTIRAGDGLCDRQVVEEIIRQGPSRINELIAKGVGFSSLADGRISLNKEGGHSKRRILHVADMTGKAIEEALLKALAAQPNADVFEHFLAIDLITSLKMRQSGRDIPFSGNRVEGLYVLDIPEGQVRTLKARAVVLATGGAGQVYLYSTNPSIATGDGIAMAYRAGVEILDMECIQFHPTTLYSTSNERFLISEAVRGEGAILKDIKGQAFMSKYHEKAELAPRDIVARAIDSEMKRSGEPHVWLDITHKPKEELQSRFPTIYENCQRIGIDLSKDWIPVVPAAHYICGGVKTDVNGVTTLPGLYACGEVGCTGLHGANRLASNSLLEAVVVAHNAAQHAYDFVSNRSHSDYDLPHWIDGNMQDSDERVVLSHNWDELKRAMWDYVGIVRTTKRLERAHNRIERLNREIHEYYWNFKVEPHLIELRNLVLIADLIVDCALQRKESRGLHYTLDYPAKLSKAFSTSASTAKQG